MERKGFLFKEKQLKNHTKYVSLFTTTLIIVYTQRLQGVKYTSIVKGVNPPRVDSLYQYKDAFYWYSLFPYGKGNKLYAYKPPLYQYNCIHARDCCTDITISVKKPRPSIKQFIRLWSCKELCMADSCACLIVYGALCRYWSLPAQRSL